MLYYQRRRLCSAGYSYGSHTINMDIKNLSIVRQTFANCVFTHKTQEIAAERNSRKSLCVKIANIVLTALVLTLLFVQTANPTNLIYSYINTGFTIAEIIFLIIQLTFNFDQQAVLHKNAALQYMNLRDRYRLLITDIMNGSESTSTISRRDALQSEYQVISNLSPQTEPSDYEEAQHRLNTAGVKGGEQFTWSDAEIDQY